MVNISDHLRSSLSSLTAQEAGALLRNRRKAMQLTQAQVVERSTVPTSQYLGSLESGRVSLAKSRHLPSLAKLMGLTNTEVTAITGVWLTSQVNEAEDVPVLSIATLLFTDLGKPRRVILSGDPQTIVMLDANDQVPVPGQWYAVDSPLLDSLDLHRALCISYGQTLLLLIGLTAYEISEDSCRIVGRLIYEIRELKSPRPTPVIPDSALED